MRDVVTIQVDSRTEMCQILRGDDCIFTGNYWDFHFPSDLVTLLCDLGALNGFTVVRDDNWTYE